ncbi:hypothetical protein Tco_0231298, partial [Tanacetum coccineum]
MARQCTQPKRPRNTAWYKDKAMLAEAQEARQILDEKQLAFLADPLVIDGQVVQTIIPNNATFQTEDLDTYDSYVMKSQLKMQQRFAWSTFSISNAELERYKERAKTFKQRLNIDLSSGEKNVDSQMEDKTTEKLQTKRKKAQRIKPTLYDGIVISDKHVAMPVNDDEETLILEEESRSKMSEKEKDPEAIKQKISYKPIDYVKLNQLSEDFRKRFVPQQELSAKQAFWYHMSNPSTKSSDASPVKMEAAKELPKVSLVNESLKKLKFHLAKFDNVVKIRTTPDARTEGEWGFEQTRGVFNNEIIPFLKSLKDIFNVFDKDLLN